MINRGFKWNDLWLVLPYILLLVIFAINTSENRERVHDIQKQQAVIQNQQNQIELALLASCESANEVREATKRGWQVVERFTLESEQNARTAEERARAAIFFQEIYATLKPRDCTPKERQ